jgi:hypothetical protein
LLRPSRNATLDDSSITRLVKALCLQLPCRGAAAERELQEILQDLSFTQWSGLRIMDGGDRIRTATQDGKAEDSREGSWVQVCYLLIFASLDLNVLVQV